MSVSIIVHGSRCVRCDAVLKRSSIYKDQSVSLVATNLRAVDWALRCETKMVLVGWLWKRGAVRAQSAVHGMGRLIAVSLEKRTSAESRSPRCRSANAGSRLRYSPLCKGIDQ